MALAVAVVVAVALRREVLYRPSGAVVCGVRRPECYPWMLGVGHYDGDSLSFYRVFSLRVRPREVMSRRRLVVDGRRRPRQEEAGALLADSVVVRCVQDTAVLEIAFSEPALTGFLAWLEASPPGTRGVWA